MDVCKPLLFGLVHLAVLLNKYILPAWFQHARVIVAETSSGAIDHNRQGLMENKHLTDVESTSRVRAST